MHFLAHRGNTLKPEPEKENLPHTLKDALDKGFGIETDIRDFNGELVISHELPKASSPKLSEFLRIIPKLKMGQAIAFNIKSDGQHKLLKSMLDDYPALKNIFFFDMSVPTLYLFSKFLPKENLATRVSDIEPEPNLYDSVQWVWIDCFTRDFDEWGKAKKYLLGGKKLAFISPELHKRPHTPFWRELKENFPRDEGVYLCTDYVEDAVSFFGE